MPTKIKTGISQVTDSILQFNADQLRLHTVKLLAVQQQADNIILEIHS